MADSARYTFASQLAVLRSCPDVISRLLKTRNYVLLAAKALVISRLLHTKLSQQPNPPTYLDSLRNRIASLRRRLLSKIDRRFKSLELPRDVLVEAMCAFSLATSSSPKDVLRHYHHIRLEAISEKMEESTNGNDNMLLALRLFVKTLKDTQAVAPGQLANALEKLKLVSLFKSHDVNSLMELNLDVHERWIAEDIKTFTPYIRHDDLSKAEAERSLKQWAKQAFSSFLNALRKRIQHVRDPSALMRLRRELIELWLSNHQHSLGINTAETLDGLRDVFNVQATRIVQNRAATLDRVGSIVQEVLHNWQPGVSDFAPLLWDPLMTSMEMTRGGKEFRERLMVRSIGRNQPLDRVSKEYSALLESIKDIEEMIKKLRETKWADEVEDMDAEDDLLDNNQVSLNEDDPGLLQDELNSALHKAYTDLQVSLEKAAPDEGDPNRGRKSSFLIRVWREIRQHQHLPTSYQNRKLGLKSIPTLQNIIADEVLRIPLKRCSKRLANHSAASRLQTRPLWEGDPELPLLPSAWTYRFLRDLASSMTECGSDLWTPHAVDTLKRDLILGIVPLVEGSREPIAERVNGYANGDADAHEETQGDHVGEDAEKGENEEEFQPKGDKAGKPTVFHANGTLPNGNHDANSEESLKDAKIQKLFDTTYLIHATTIRNLDPADNKLIQLQNLLVHELTLEAKSVQRMKKDAGEYWKRTSLLFALLA